MSVHLDPHGAPSRAALVVLLVLSACSGGLRRAPMPPGQTCDRYDPSTRVWSSCRCKSEYVPNEGSEGGCRRATWAEKLGDAPFAAREDDLPSAAEIARRQRVATLDRDFENAISDARTVYLRAGWTLVSDQRHTAYPRGVSGGGPKFRFAAGYTVQFVFVGPNDLGLRLEISVDNQIEEWMKQYKRGHASAYIVQTPDPGAAAEATARVITMGQSSVAGHLLIFERPSAR